MKVTLQDVNCIYRINNQKQPHNSSLFLLLNFDIVFQLLKLEIDFVDVHTAEEGIDLWKFSVGFDTDGFVHLILREPLE